jgi:hypothetical protein
MVQEFDFDDFPVQEDFEEFYRSLGKNSGLFLEIIGFIGARRAGRMPLNLTFMDELDPSFYFSQVERYRSVLYQIKQLFESQPIRDYLTGKVNELTEEMNRVGERLPEDKQLEGMVAS